MARTKRKLYGNGYVPLKRNNAQNENSDVGADDGRMEYEIESTDQGQLSPSVDDVESSDDSLHNPEFVNTGEDSEDDESLEIPIDSEEFDLSNQFQDLEDDLLCVLAEASISRSSNKGFLRKLPILNNHEKSEIGKKVWSSSWRFTSMYFCNTCARQIKTDEKCCGDTVKFLRVPVIMQMKRVVEENFSEIMSLREKLRAGEAGNHNLNKTFFRRHRQEKNNECNLSLLMSIDGVSPLGHTNQKIWPVTSALLDLKTGTMSVARNLILMGILECDSDPSTQCWNSILPILLDDMKHNEEFAKINDIAFSAAIVLINADQPAKRKLFGMRGGNSSLSCFFCLSSGTLYKSDGDERNLYRGCLRTREDSRNAENGFGDTHAEILYYVMPYETPIDMLHNLGEGILDTITKEILQTVNNSKSVKPKSEIFRCDPGFSRLLSSVQTPTAYKNLDRRRNGTDKMNFFRINIMLSSLVDNSMSENGNCIVVGLALLSNAICTDAEKTDGFYDDICVSIRNLFHCDQYFVIKFHEILWHLPFTTEAYGNNGPLSTSMFETIYKVLFSDFHTSITKNFIDKAAHRFLFDIHTEREIMKRYEAPDPSFCIREFAKASYPTARSSFISCPLKKIANVDKELVGDEKTFGCLSTTFGRIVSKLRDENTTSDWIFYKGERSFCGRFVLAFHGEENIKVLVEPLQVYDDEYAFTSITTKIRGMTGPDFVHASRILAHLKSFKGIANGVLSCSRICIDLSNIIGVGACIHQNNGFIVTCINGLPIHN